MSEAPSESKSGCKSTRRHLFRPVLPPRTARYDFLGRKAFPGLLSQEKCAQPFVEQHIAKLEGDKAEGYLSVQSRTPTRAGVVCFVCHRGKGRLRRAKFLDRAIFSYALRRPNVVQPSCSTVAICFPCKRLQHAE